LSKHKGENFSTIVQFKRHKFILYLAAIIHFNRLKPGLLKLWYAWRGGHNVPAIFKRLYLWFYLLLWIKMWLKFLWIKNFN